MGNHVNAGWYGLPKNAVRYALSVNAGWYALSVNAVRYGLSCECGQVWIIMCMRSGMGYNVNAVRYGLSCECGLVRVIAVSESMNRDLNRVSVWCNLWEMKLNASKTKTMIVSRS